MTSIIRTAGQSRPYEVATGYRHASRFSSRWERPEGELSWLAGSALTLAVVAIIAMIGAML